MRDRLTWIVIVSLAAACGGGEGNQPDAPPVDNGFNKPTAALKANTEVSENMWMELGPADLSCLNTPSADIPTAVVVKATTTVEDFQSGNLVPNTVVTAFPNQDVAAPFDTQTADSTTAGLTITIPVGTKRFGYKMTNPEALDTLLLNQTVKPDQMNQTVSAIQSVSKTTAATLPALIGVSRTPGTGVLAGAMRDCQDHEVSNFIATVSTTKGTATIAQGADSYYFSASVGLPVRHSQQAASSNDGLFMVIELAPQAESFVQVWGYPTDADLAADRLTLIAELQTPVVADTVITGSYEPLRQ